MEGMMSYAVAHTPAIASWASCGSGSLISLPPLREAPDDVTLGFEGSPEQMFPVTRRRT
jgi:hypothetical protein